MPVDMPSGLLGPAAPGAGQALPPMMGPSPSTGGTVTGRRRHSGQTAGKPRRHTGVKRRSRGGRGRKAAKKY